ncbi:MAG: GAP family protein [Mycobacterium sp.]|nr:GAP family protein [Mycobacterium sp.]
MWGLVLLFALSAAQDPVRIGVMALLIARPRPMHNLLAYWLGLMATGYGAALAALFGLHDFLSPVARVMTSVARHPAVPPTQIALGVVVISTAAMLAVRSSPRQVAHAAVPGAATPGGDPSPMMLQPNTPTGFSRMSLSSWSGLLQSMVEGRSLRMAFVAGLCTSTQVIECGAAMIAIIASGAAAGTQVSAALLFTLVAFAIVEVPLVSCLVAPAKTQVVVMRLHDWLRAHRRPISLLVLGMVGVFMLVSGVGKM